MTKQQIRATIIKNGVKNLKDFGYPDCTAENILEVMIFRSFFEDMLQKNLGGNEQTDEVINELLSEIKTAEENSKKKQPPNFFQPKERDKMAKRILKHIKYYGVGFVAWFGLIGAIGLLCYFIKLLWEWVSSPTLVNILIVLALVGSVIYFVIWIPYSLGKTIIED